MTTKRLVPRSNKDGGIGSQDKPWLNGYFKETHAVGSMFYPITTSLARPNNAQTGQIFFDTTINGLIIWDGAKWIELTNPISFALNALTVTTDGEYGIGGQVGGGGIYSKGQQVTLTATADEHYSFVRWSGDLTELAQELERITTVNMTGSFNIFAEFAVESYTLTLQAGPNGEIVSGSGSYPYSTYAEIEAKPEPGYDFSGWSSSVSGSVVDPSSAKTQVFVDADMNITASFRLKPYEIFTNIFGSGSVNISETATYNSQVVIEKIPDPGYENNNLLTKVRDRSGNLIEVLTRDDGLQYFQMPNSDVFIDVFFDAIEYTITDSSDDNVNVSITKTSAIVDDKIYFSVNFQRGYEIDGDISLITSDGTPITLTPEDDQGINFSFIMPAKNVILIVSSVIINYGITLISEPLGSSVLNARLQNLSEYTLDPQGFTTEASYNEKVFIDIQESEGYKPKSFSGQKDNGGLLSIFGLHKPGIHEYGLDIDYDFHTQYDPSVALAKDDLNNIFFYMPEDSVTITGIFEEHKYFTRIENIPNSYSFSSTFGVDESSTTFTYEPLTNHKFFAFSCYGNTGSIDKNITLEVNISTDASFSLSSEADLYNNRSIKLEIPSGKTMAELSEFLSSDTVYKFSLDTNLSSSFVFTSAQYSLQGSLSSHDFTDIDISNTENSLGDEVAIELTPQDGYDIVVDYLNLTRMDNGESLDFEVISDVYQSNISFTVPPAGTLLGYSMIPTPYAIEIIESADSNNGLTEIVTDNLELIGDSFYSTVNETISLTNIAFENFELIEYQSYYINPKDASGTQNDFFIGTSNPDSTSFTMPAGNVYITPIFLGIESDIYYTYTVSELSLSGFHPTSARYTETVNISKTDLIPTAGFKVLALKIHKYEADSEGYSQNKGELIDIFEDIELLADDAIISFTMPNHPIVIDIEAAAEPIPDFLISPDEYYFGSIIELTDISTAPSGDGNIVTAEFSNNSGATFGSLGKRLRTYSQLTDSAPYVEIQTVNGSSTYDYGDFSNKEWTILIDSEKIPGVPEDGRAAVFNKDDHHWFIRNYNDDAMSHYSRTNAGWVYSGNIGLKLTGRFGMSCTATTQTVWANNGGATGNKSGTHLAPLNPSRLLRLFSAYPEYAGNYTDNHLSFPALTERIIFIPRAITGAEFQEFYAGTPVQELSFYTDIDDYINAGTGTYPSLNGELGNITARLVDGSESHFKTIASLTLPDGSPGETSGSVDITLTVTDDEGITKEITKTINYVPTPLPEPEITDLEKFVTTEDGLNILGSPSITSVETELVQGGETITNQLL